MDTAHSFIQTIIESPQSDAPRLVYADWLEENHQPERADFIRSQCLHASLPVSDPRVPLLQSHEAELLAVHGEDWLGALTEVGRDWKYHRGFIVAGDLVKLATPEHVQTLFRLAPLFKTLRCNRDEAYLGRFFKESAVEVMRLLFDPEKGPITGLDFSNSGLDDFDASWVIDDIPSCIKRLDLSFNQLGNDGLSEIGDILEQQKVVLEELNLAGNRIEGWYDYSPESFKHDWRRTRQGQDFHLTGKVAEHIDASSRWASPCFRSLRSLNLARNPFHALSVRQLLHDGLTSLVDLDLSYIDFGPAEDVANQDLLPSHNFLAYGRYPTYLLGDHPAYKTAAEFVVLSLAIAPIHLQLERLNFAGNGLDDDGIWRFRTHSRHYLDTSNMETWNDGWEHEWPQLKTLILSRDCFKTPFLGENI